MSSQPIVDEVFVEIEGYPKYSVSNYGRVINTDKDKELVGNVLTDGSMQVTLRNEGVVRRFYIHRLVAKAFFVNYSEGYEVNHITDNKSDNSVLNITLGHKKCRKKNDEV